MTLDFEKKTRTTYHHISLKGGYAIPRQTRLSGKSNCQNLESQTRTTAADSDVFPTERATHRVSLSRPGSNGMITATIPADVAQDAIRNRDVAPTSRDSEALLQLPEAVGHNVESK